MEPVDDDRCLLCVCLQSSDAHWLSPTDREQVLMELRSMGWVPVEDRDAIFKELHFKTFNQVCHDVKDQLLSLFN